jgi:hypothetical protein
MVVGYKLGYLKCGLGKFTILSSAYILMGGMM